MKAPRLIALAIVLAGCVGPPEVPDDAVHDADPALPGLTLFAWTEERGDRLQLHALVVNDHDDGYWYRVNCGEPWNITLSGPGGQDIGFRSVQEPAGCAPQYEILQPKQHIDSLWSWDFRDHDPEAGTSEAVLDGNYTWSVSMGVRDVPARLALTFDVEVVAGALRTGTPAG